MASLLRVLFVLFLIGQLSSTSHAQCKVLTSIVPLSWNANTELDIDFYKVYRSLTSGSGDSLIGTTAQGADPISFTDMMPLSIIID